ncbi:MAG: nucleotidyltransferase family protein [Marinicaulis sp.]|nr:nucleotidyltransferase family protein [Marinicaulis sp.]NNL87489.1 nucleotidyltransferase family protein [Marinicaulis sp.]
MVLAAGLGTRMRPLTLEKPKPLIEISGKSLIDHALDRFANSGVSRSIVNVHYLADKIEAHLKGRNRPEVFISDEREQLLETGGGLQAALPLFPQDEIFCTNTDAVFVDDGANGACETLKAHWDDNRMDALLLLAPIEKTTGYYGDGDFNIRDNGEITFRRKAMAPFVFTGLQLIATSLIKEGPGGAYSTKKLWDIAAKSKRLHGVVYDGFWMHVGDPAGLEAAEKFMSNRHA